MDKILYIDVEYRDRFGADMNRSRYIVGALRKELEVHHCIVEEQESKQSDVSLWLQPSKKKKFLMPDAIKHFSAEASASFVRYIKEHKIERLFFRHISFCELAYYAKEKMPSLHIIVDEDFRMSRLMQQAWRLRPSLSSRYFFIEYHKLKRYESKLYDTGFTMLFSNTEEIEDLRIQYPHAKIRHMPNTTDLKVHQPSKTVTKQILFFGAMDSITNKEGYNYIVDKVYPLIDEAVVKYDYTIYIAGKGCEALLPSPYERIKIIGKVDSMEETILQSDFVVLPVFVASGTNTRVIETAMAGKALITTPLAAEGLVQRDKVDFVVQSAEEMAKKMIQYIEDEEIKFDAATQLQNQIVQKCSSDTLHQKMHAVLSEK